MTRYGEDKKRCWACDRTEDDGAMFPKIKPYGQRRLCVECTEPAQEQKADES